MLIATYEKNMSTSRLIRVTESPFSLYKSALTLLFSLMHLQMTRLANAQIIILLLLLLTVIVIVESNPISKRVHQRASNGSASSPWLNKVTNRGPRPRPPGCWDKPWICRMDKPPGTRMRCCRNRCVNVLADVDNCGWCGIRCPFTWQCCRGFCSNTNISPVNCGKCGNRCPWGVRCYYGMCGYAHEPWPRPRPRPPWPRPPRPCPPPGSGSGGKHPPLGDQPSPMR